MIENAICTYFTHAGDVSPFSASTASPLPLARRAEAVAAAGFAGIGFARDDIIAVIEQHGTAEVNRILDANGLNIRELEVLPNWFVRDERRAASDALRADLFRAADAIGARHIKVVGDLEGRPSELGPMVEAFQQLCAQAATHGCAITIELYPSSNLADLQTGYTLVEQAGCANGGLLLDIWHMVRGQVPMAAIASLPAGVINHVELDDGAMLPLTDYFTDTCNARCECGQGEFPVADFMRAIVATGYEGLYGAEILSHDFRAMSVEEATRRALEGIRYALDSVQVNSQ